LGGFRGQDGVENSVLIDAVSVKIGGKRKSCLSGEVGIDLLRLALAYKTRINSADYRIIRIQDITASATKPNLFFITRQG